VLPLLLLLLLLLLRLGLKAWTAQKERISTSSQLLPLPLVRSRPCNFSSGSAKRYVHVCRRESVSFSLENKPLSLSSFSEKHNRKIDTHSNWDGVPEHNGLGIFFYLIFRSHLQQQFIGVDAKQAELLHCERRYHTSEVYVPCPWSRDEDERRRKMRWLQPSIHFPTTLNT